MQTFVPHPDLTACAAALDLRRLGKQIIEARQIGRAITDPTYGWQNHPAVNMWRESLPGLLAYADAMATEWRLRRGKDHGAWINMQADHPDVAPDPDSLPLWWGSADVHRSHRAALYRKDPQHYAAYSADSDAHDDYVWPGAGESSPSPTQVIASLL